jgi:transposase
MTAKRIEMHRLQELVRLFRMDVGCREVTRLLKMGTNVERRYREALDLEGLLRGDPRVLPDMDVLKAAVLKHLPPRKPPVRASSIEPWAEEIRLMLEKKASPTSIYDCLRLGHEDFGGSLSAVKRFCLREKKDRGIDPLDVAICVESEPGKIAQVDFGYVGKLFDPERRCMRRAWVFVMVLGFSRHMFAEIAFDQSSETWLRLHVRAFEFFGGCVDTLVPDNLKAAVVRAAFAVDGPTSLNRSYRELARHYGCKVDPAPPYSPEKKGKAESSVKYVKGNFFRPRSFPDVDEARRELPRWILEIAGRRIHGTTKKRPLELFEKCEKAALLPLPASPFEMVVWKRARVHQDSHIVFDKRLYSVPWKNIGREVWVRATAGTVGIYFDDVRIATHDRRGEGWRSTRDEHLPDHRSDYRHRSRSYWEERARKLGDPVERYIREVFDSDDVLSRLRTVQGMVKHLESFPPSRACAACERASFFGNYTLRGLKGILRQALDLEPLFDEKPQDSQPKTPYRFARKAGEFSS